jgi:hypothetical protein
VTGRRAVGGLLRPGRPCADEPQGRLDILHPKPQVQCIDLRLYVQATAHRDPSVVRMLLTSP